MLCQLSLVGCKAKEPISSFVEQKAEEYPVLYNCASISLPEEQFIVGWAAVDGSNIYFTGQSMLADGETIKIYVYDRDFRQKSAIPLTEDGIHNRFPTGLCADGLGNVFVLERLSELGNSHDIAAWRIEMLSADGKTRREFEPEELAFPLEIKADQEYIYLYGIDRDEKAVVAVYDRDFKLRLTLTEAEKVSSIFFSADGDLCLCTAGLEKGQIKKLDMKSAKFVKVCTVENDSSSIQQGRAVRIYNGYEYDCCTVSDGWLCGLSFTSGEKTPICSLESYDFAPRATDYIPLGDGEFLVRSSRELMRLSPSDIPAESVTTLTLGTLDAKFLTASVQKFNSENPSCRIEIEDYSKYDLSPDSGEGLRRLNTEIISGSGPDILDLCSLPVSTYLHAGLLCDLKPFIAADPSYKNMEFVPTAEKVLETDGKLYALVPAYSIMSFVGSAELGGDNSLSLSRLSSLSGQMSEGENLFGTIFSKRDFLNCILSVADSAFLDYAGQTCRFDSPEFGELLEFAASLPDEADRSEDLQMIAKRQQLLSVNHFGGYGSLIAWNYYFGDSLSFLGVPSGDGAGAILCPYISLGISRNCQTPELAWSFLRSFLSDEFQFSTADNLLPISQKAMDYKRESFKSWMDGGGIFSLLDADGNEVSFPASDSDPFALMGRLMLCVNSVYDEKQALCDLIWSDAKAYFAGDISLEEAQARLQSRASIFISEQYG